MATNQQNKGGAQDKGNRAAGKGNQQAGTEAANQGGTKNRGFASMDPARQREIASEGGKAAHQKGTAHEFTSKEARRAGSMSHGNRQSETAARGGAANAGNASGTPAERTGERQGEHRGEDNQES